MKLVVASLLVSVVGVVACGTSAEPVGSTAEAVTDDGIHVHAAKGSRSTAPSPLVDHGGPVLASSATYAIFWGPLADFPGDEVEGVQSILEGFGGSSYLAMANQYMRGATATSTFGGSTFDGSSPPSHAPKTSALGAEVCKLFPHPDPDGIYFVLTSNRPNISYCAWHAGASCNGVTFQVAYMPNMNGDTGCSPYTVSNLGCNTYSDATVALLDGLAHEYLESTTDPQISAWYDKNGQEMMDKCDFVYGSCVTLANQTTWQIQEGWSNAAGGCVQTLP